MNNLQYKLYDIDNRLENFLVLAESGEFTDECIADTSEFLGSDVEYTAVEVAKFNKNTKSSIAVLAEEIKRLQNRKAALEKLAKAVNEKLTEVMKKADRPKIKTPLFSIYIQKNPASLVVDNEEKAIEAGYKNVDVTVDKAKLKEDIQNGKKCDFAHLEQTEGIRIK